MSDARVKRTKSDAQRAPTEGECVAFIVSCFTGLHPAHAQRVLRGCGGDVMAAVEHYQSLLCAQELAREEGRPFPELDGSGLSTAEVARAASGRHPAAAPEEDELTPEDERTLNEFIRTHSDTRAPAAAGTAAASGAGKADAWAASEDEMATEESEDEGAAAEAEVVEEEEAVDDATLSQLVEVFPQFAFEHVRSVLVQHKGDFDAAVDELAELDSAADEAGVPEPSLTRSPVSLAAGASVVAWKKHTPQRAPPPPSLQQKPRQGEGRPQLIGRSARLKRLGSMYGQYIDKDVIEEVFSASHERIDETEVALRSLFPDICEKVAEEQQKQQEKQKQQEEKQKQQQQKQQQQKGTPQQQQQQQQQKKKGKVAKRDPSRPVPGTRIDARGEIHVPRTQAAGAAPNAAVASVQDFVDEEYRQRAECHRFAAAAFAEGDHERMRKLLALARSHEERINAVRQEAVGDALVRAPSFVRRTHVLDLHFFRPAEALALLESTLLAPHDLAGTTLLVITGRGAHSRNHRAVVRPAVEKWLRDHRFAFKDVNGGSFNVFL